MSEPLTVPVNRTWLGKVDGNLNDEAIYLGILVPLMNAIDEHEERLSDTQRLLALVGLAYLEILNGGVEQLVSNCPNWAEETPAAMKAMGWGAEAELLAEALALILPLACEPPTWLDRLAGREGRRRDFVQLVRAMSPEATTRVEAIQRVLGDFLESPGFFMTVIDRVRGDTVGFVLTDGPPSTS
ncbi:DMP19 family protein [Caulobacter sp. LARHSG274]